MIMLKHKQNPILYFLQGGQYNYKLHTRYNTLRAGHKVSLYQTIYYVTDITHKLGEKEA
jgi:hypothetical protein